MTQEKLQQIKILALGEIEKTRDAGQLQNLEIKYLGRKGELTQVLRTIGGLPEGERGKIGNLANQVKQEIATAIGRAKHNLGAASGVSGKEWIDVTASKAGRQLGHLHPISIIQYELEDLFTSMGFMVLDGPELESEYYNFEALNIPSWHPARDMQDTFYVEGENLLMRTHTSPVQVRAMEKYGAPLRAIVPGRCFRNEATDARHEHTFDQLEGVVIGRDINFSHMKGVMQAAADYLFGKGTKIRLMPKYYPFVEPGVRGEVTCFLCAGKGCRVCKNGGWLEVMPGGMIHPNVLRAGGIDPEKYSGFAFGFGLTRLVMLKYGIDDVRLFRSGDLRFLNQF